MDTTSSILQPVHISKEDAQHLLHQMLRIRRFEEKAAEMYTQNKIKGFLHLYIGEEAVAVGVIEALRPEDAVVATYREHGHALIKGVSADSIMAEMFGKQEGCSRGRGGSMHLFDAATRFYGGNAIVGGHLPLAVGMALADKMQNQKVVTTCFFGEGAVAEGEFHESLNLAALWKTPTLFICENNGYAMGTALDLSESQTDIHAKAASYQIPSEVVDGMDVLAVREATERAVAHILNGEGPYFLECRTYRLRAHSMFDAELDREKSEVEEWKKHGPIVQFIKRTKKQDLLNNEDIAAIEKQVAAEVDASVAFAEAGTLEPLSDLLKFVYSEK